MPELAGLHANKQAHCDIKPGNIMQRSAKVQLIDYDFVKACRCARLQDDTSVRAS